jgi:hypothetical protein
MRVERVQLAPDYLEHRATSHEAIRLIVIVDQSNLAAISTLRLVPGESNASVLPKNFQAWRREHRLAKRLRADGLASKQQRAPSSAEAFRLRL